MREHLEYISKDIVNISLIFLFAYLIGSFNEGTFNISLWDVSFRGFVVFITSIVTTGSVLLRLMMKFE